jgi:hypothetical protein
MTRPGRFGLLAIAAGLLLAAQPAAAPAQTMGPEAGRPDGAHDFDFLIGRWKVHLKKLINPLTGSTHWVEYDGRAETRKYFDSNMNIEDFEVDDPADHLHMHIQALRLYDPVSRQWSIYGFDAGKGTMDLPATIGRFTDGRGELYDQENWKGQWIQVRFVWTHPDAAHAQMVQSFSTDGGKTWEANWICDETRVGD